MATAPPTSRRRREQRGRLDGAYNAGGGHGGGHGGDDNDDAPRLAVASLALRSRLIVLALLALSDMALTDHDPGEGVARFDLRLGREGAGGSEGADSGRAGRPCFCLEGHACDNRGDARPPPPAARDRRRIGRSCAPPWDARSGNPPRATPRLLDGFYRILLSPLTKWDGARFLALAVDSGARLPRESARGSGARRRENEADHFAESEQAHAFFPFFPLCVRCLALCLTRSAPVVLLPSTFEGVAALSAMLLNLGCFVAAAIALFDATEALLRKSVERPDGERIRRASRLAAAHFCFNPASVFFSVAYSESMFAALTFWGHRLLAHSLGAASTAPGEGWGWAWAAALLPWTLASYVRSNGTFSSVLILLMGIGRVVYLLDREWWASANTDLPAWKRARHVLPRAFWEFLAHFTAAIVVASPVFYHERRGYAFHCTNGEGFAVLPDAYRPPWCLEAESKGRGFSLYSHVQRKHWNVGFLRYYQLKQLPNFLLALPILALGAMATACWIGTSRTRYILRRATNPDNTGTGQQQKQKCPSNRYVAIIDWAIFALDESVPIHGSRTEDTRFTKEGDTPTVKIARALCAPFMLSHYATLTGFCLVGATIAHVQISTRLVCSSCPALYWFMASLSVAGGKNMHRILSGYSAVFILVGCILHPNFLPWT